MYSVVYGALYVAVDVDVDIYWRGRTTPKRKKETKSREKGKTMIHRAGNETRRDKTKKPITH
jgi:hypothetical protein